MKEQLTSPQEALVKNGIYFSKRLQDALSVSAYRPATIVEAPTGYGKTVAVRHFCKNAGMPVKWINNYSDDPAHAWGSLCRALFSDVEEVSRFLRWPFPAYGMQRDSFVKAFDREFPKDQPFILVIDDYHLIKKPQINQFFVFFVREFADRVRLILISQKKVSKEEEVLIATGKVHRITSEDLRFSREDVDHYLELCNLTLPEEEIAKIYEKSEGWISMIYVTVLNYLKAGQSDLSADMEHLVDRAAYAGLSHGTKHLLSYLALVQDFTKEQADFLNGGESSTPMLAELLEDHAFFDKDPETDTYHFHTIFKDCIYHHFEKLSLSEQCIRYERLAEYHLLLKDHNRAIGWYEKAGNYEGILRTLEKFETICSEQEDRALMLRCFDHCPKVLFEDHPLCLVLFMWRFYNYGKRERVSECCALFEKLMPQIKLSKEERDYLWKSYHIFLAQNAFPDLDKMRDYLDKAVILTGEDLPKVDGDMPRNFGIPSVFHMFYANGQGKQVVSRLKDHFGKCVKMGLQVPSYEGIQSLAQAEYHFYTGNLEQAEIYDHKALMKFRENMLPCYVLSAKYLSAHIAFLKGEFDKAKETLKEMRSMVLRENSEVSCLSYTVDMCEAFFYEHMGYPVRMAEWIRRSGYLPEEILPQAYPYAIMIRMVVGLHDEKYTQILGAEDEINAMIRDTPYQLTVGNVCLIFASAAAAIDRESEALAYIKKAVERIGFELPVFYSKYGEWLMKPLQKLSREDERYKPIIAACRKFMAVKKDCRGEEAEIFPILTNRENDIALLAMKGMTNKQIAATLYISENTVKSSLKNIFSKLEIGSRHELSRIAGKSL
ncbi:MAG: hypothetical protein J1E61_04025 [Lachnospiraceae bacterium]|nr:hypothetical protein [Lachnospiraceae bacterium]